MNLIVARCLVVISVFVMSSCVAKASGDTSEVCQPTWTTDAALSYVDIKVRHGLSEDDNGIYLPDKNGRLVRAAKISDVRDKPHAIQTFSDTSFIDLKMLAWQRLLIDTIERRALLFLAKYRNASNELEWALITLVSDDSGLVWKVPRWGDNPLRQYPDKPTNMIIYEFLSEIVSIECRFFIYGEDGKYDWKGVEVAFIEGAVCEETWEEVIGEKPEKHLPAR